jgi:ATP-dependent Lon protease
MADLPALNLPSSSLSDLPLLPLRGLVVFPESAVPLTVGQPRSIKLIDDVVAQELKVVLVAAKDPSLETPNPDDIHTIGTLAAVHRFFRAPDGTIRVLVQGLERVRVVSYSATEPYLKATVELLPEEIGEIPTDELEALSRTVGERFSKLSELVPSIPTELVETTVQNDDPFGLAYSIATYIRIDLADQQKLLEMPYVDDKMRFLLGLLNQEINLLELGRKIQEDAQTEIEKAQKDFFLREQIKAIQRELGEGEDRSAEIDEFRAKIEAAGMPPEAHKEATRELDRLSRLTVAAAEYGVIRTYLDWMVSLPWSKTTPDNLDLRHARQVLDEDHYGLKDIKERILEFLAIRKLKADRAGQFEATKIDYARRDREGAILCFVGPPGVGKTSLGASIARAMGRRFVRLSLGGIRDEAEIRGFRRTYIGAMPGRMVQTLRRLETRNPIIMLDEIDKLGRDFRGDPASALLEVLDPEQNHEFRDHYLDVPLDLSQVMFITTANQLDPIPDPLLDRMEVIALAGYTEQEKTRIAQDYLIPRQRREHLLRDNELLFQPEAIQSIIQDYTREAGVRNLEREIGKIARKVATQIAEQGESAETAADGARLIDRAKTQAFLGHPKFGYREEISERTDRPGVATALAATAIGGDVLFVEAAQMPGGKGFQYTGQLGEVMQESARAAFSYIRSEAKALGLDEKHFEMNDIHLHVPAGAVPKDGPSAGVTMAAALASLLSGRPVRKNVAMTGEITLRGQVLPVGGIKDKVLAAHRLGVDTIILPRRNAPDLEELPDEVRNAMHFILAQNVDEVIQAALEPNPTPVSPDSTVKSGKPRTHRTKKEQPG